ncbi:MAG: MmgE/PrpD family protein [Acidimicrobiia bacterium]|nr:MmgE/PrpD family protein [Acidimicrobiia bacterium]
MSNGSAVTASRELADFLADLSGGIDDRLTALATDYLVDTLGCIVFGSQQPWSQAVIGHALATGADGPCTVIGTVTGIDAESSTTPAMAAVPAERARSTTPSMAALANGASAHAFELDDVHEEAISHPGAVVVPAALAIGQSLDAAMTDVLEAIVVGYEAMGRAGIAVGPAAHMLGGFHPTSMSGVFGAAAAAGRLLGFDGALLNHTFGIATSFASGTMEFAASGGMAKRVHAGRAAEGGVTAALLVARGFEGADDGLAGRYGFCRVFTDAPRIELLTEDLGARWMIDEITVKPYAACSDIHPMIQAAAELRREAGPGGLTAEHIVRIEAEGPTKAAEQNSLDGTASVMAAQYSAQWNIAAALVSDPGDPAIYAPDRITDPAVAALQSKVVSVTAHPDFDATYAQKMGGRVRITLDDGSVLERSVHGQIGSMHAPLTAAQIDAKFARVTGGLLPDPLAAAAAIRVTAAEPDVTTSDLISALGFGRRHTRGTD